MSCRRQTFGARWKSNLKLVEPFCSRRQKPSNQMNTDGTTEVANVPKNCSKLPASEILGNKFAQKLTQYILERGGYYLRDESGVLHVVINERRITLDLNRDNTALAEVMLNACNVSL